MLRDDEDRRDPARRDGGLSLKLISVITPCYEEELNVAELYRQVKQAFDGLGYSYEHLFIDNASKDRTVEVLRGLAREDHNVKVIVNTRNFGHIRSPYHALLQARGDAVIGMAADLQDPPHLIPELIKRWEEGYRVALGVKISSKESRIMAWVRRSYYQILARLSEVQVINDSTGFGIYDRSVIEIIRKMEDPYPYFRGLLPEIGFPIATIPYHQPLRARGKSHNSFYSLFDLAMLGVTTHSKVPLRLATIAGFSLSALSLLVAAAYLVAKLLFWYRFPAGIAPILIGLFVTFSVQLFFLGLLGEYIGAVHTHAVKRPLVVERERINFDPTSSD